MLYTFFDIETPNRRNDRICSIGLVQTNEHGATVRSDYILIDPESRFDESNMSVHGISPAAVDGAPTFVQAWESVIAPYIAGPLLSAHNASFDLAVLAKTMQAYHIDMPSIEYACTMAMAQRSPISPKSYRLPDVCAALGIPMGAHHNALDDADACRAVFWALSEGFSDGPLFHPYSYNPGREHAISRKTVDKAMTDLYGLLIGLSIDGKIGHCELDAIKGWMSNNDALRSDRTMSFVFSVMDGILADGVVTDSERKVMFDLVRKFVQESEFAGETLAMQELLGMLKGVKADGVINAREAANLLDWIDDHEEIASDRAVAPIFSIIAESLEDGIISDEEHEAIKGAIDGFLSPAEGCCGIEFQGKAFVLSGDFIHGPKKDVEAFIESKGGTIAKGVSKKVSYVVIGDAGSERYAFGNYGTKAKKALELKSKGVPIDVVHESDLYSC